MMKLNSIFIGIFIFSIISSACIGIKEKGNTPLKNQVILNKQDTIINDSLICLRMELFLDNKKVILTNLFCRNKKNDVNNVFNLNNYLGLTVQYQNVLLNNFVGFSEKVCQNSSSKFFEVFKGDSIDNPDGFKYLDYSKGNIEYIVLRGYFFGCNGSFCNNGALLIMNFQNNTLQKAYLIGVDKSIINLSSINGYIIKNNLFLSITNNYKAKDILLSFKDQIGFINNTPKELTDVGLFCIIK